MNANQLINMVMRMFMRQTINKGLNAGIKHSRRKLGTKGPGRDPHRANTHIERPQKDALAKALSAQKAKAAIAPKPE